MIYDIEFAHVMVLTLVDVSIVFAYILLLKSMYFQDSGWA
jgi:hypothetical protein